MEINVRKLKEYGERVRLLYVEDDVGLREQVAKFLGKFFPVIDVAENGRAGLSLYEANNCYDIVVSDIAMPEMDGIQMCREIRERNQEQRIIITSAYNDSDYLLELINIGVEKFVLKPIDNKQFLSALYHTTREIVLEAELKRQEEEARAILDFSENAIVLTDGERRLVRANRRFLEMTGFESVEAFNQKVSDLGTLFLKVKGYEYGLSLGKLLERVRREPEIPRKVIMVDWGLGKKARVFLFSCKEIPGGDRTIVSLTNITSVEQDILSFRHALETNPFTGAPNKVAILRKLEELGEEQEPHRLLAFTIANLETVVKWHGKEAGYDMERSVSDHMKRLLKESKLTGRVFFGNYDRNRFLLVVPRELAGKAAQLIVGLGGDVAHRDSELSSRYETIHLSIGYKTLEFDPMEKIDILVERMDQAFRTLLQE